MKKRTALGISSLIVVLVISYFFYSIHARNQALKECMSMPASQEDIRGHGPDIVIHIHPVLSIMINGVKLAIPDSVGRIDGKYMRPIHTHDATGTLHVEAKCYRTFRLEEFFEIWGKQFTKECIMSFCRNETHDLTFTVNGKPNDQYELLALRDLDKIEIVYGPNK